MTTPQNHSFTTQIVHADRLGGAEQGAIHKPIHTSVQYGYEKVEDLIAVFQGTAKGGFNYARQVFIVGAARIFTIKFYIVGVVARPLHALDGALQYFFAG